MTDQMIEAARFLTAQLEYARHQRWAAELFDVIDKAAARLRSTVNGPSEKRYLGPCGATLCSLCGIVEANHVCEGDIPVWLCEGDIYAPRGGNTGRCRTCGATVPAADRKAWLDGKVRDSDLVWTAIGIAHALGLNVKTIRSWAVERRAPNGVVLRRAKLATYWHNGEQLVPWVDPLPGQNVRARGDRLHYVADVVRLAAEAAQRRTEEQQTTEEDAA